MKLETPKRAMEMTRPWKSQNDFHTRLDISHRTRAVHIPTSHYWHEEGTQTQTHDEDTRQLVGTGHQVMG